LERSKIINLGLALSWPMDKLPDEFGLYYFIASVYNFLEEGSMSLSTWEIFGIAFGAAVLIVAIIAVDLRVMARERGDLSFQTRGKGILWRVTHQSHWPE
jgi:hypothetical protein